MNGSPKTSVNTAVNAVLTHAPGKTRVYLQKTGYTREIPGSASMPRAPYSQGPCANCGAHRLLKYAHRTMCARYKCQKARLAGGGADDAVVPTFCFKRHPGPGAPHRRVDPLAERQGALAAHAAGYASRQEMPQKYSPSSGIHTISHTTHECTSSLHCLQRCVPLHSGARRPACMQHKQTRCRSSRCGQSQHTAQRVRGRVAAGVTTLDSGGAPSKNSRPTRPHLTERVNTSRGAVLTRLNTSTAMVLTVNV